MKWILTLSLACCFSSLAHAQYPQNYEIQKMEGDHISPVDQFYLDEIHHYDAAPTRIQETRNEMKENPRNAAFAASFGNVSSKTPLR